MRPRDKQRAKSLEQGLIGHSVTKVPLQGVSSPNMRACFVEQLIESIRRVEYVKRISVKKISSRRLDPADNIFDPIYAAIVHKRNGNIEEAIWLTFLFVHFGKHAIGGWRYLKDVYGSLVIGPRWTWSRLSANPVAFRTWLSANADDIKNSTSPGGFGNHRKYLSLDAHYRYGTGAAIESYVNWTGQSKKQQSRFTGYCSQATGDPHLAFELLYQSLNCVASFGRTARFDYLAMIGKLGLAPIAPGAAYLDGSSGPIEGAKLLFFGTTTAKASAKEMDSWLQDLDTSLNVGMQPLEDALCNWQKSPKTFRAFRG